jgi:hypothetical protein
MSQQLINRSPDLKQLRDEGYDVEVRSNYLLVKQVPYVNSNKEVKRGILVSELTVDGDITTTPNTHVVRFIGEHPCHSNGSGMTKMVIESGPKQLDHKLVVDFTFSRKPISGSYRNFYEKMTTYVALLLSQAEVIDPSVTARVFPVIEADKDESVFNYIDTASSRAEINVVTRKLEIDKIGIVGIGGTGSYVLDLVAKTPVREIHVFDGDKFSNHNAFRSPGAPSVDELKKAGKKVTYFQEVYSKMHRHIIPHGDYIDASNVDQLKAMDFVFLCLDHGGAKKLIVENLEAFCIPFVDVGMGVNLIDGSLTGLLRTTTCTTKKHDHVRSKIPFPDGNANNEYARNIQIADLNALNAALAVVKWKKLFGFYLDLEKEHFSAYAISGNAIVNEDQT